MLVFTSMYTGKEIARIKGLMTDIVVETNHVIVYNGTRVVARFPVASTAIMLVEE